MTGTLSSGLTHQEHARWCAEVRDPATANAEPAAHLKHGQSTVTWQLAAIPTGWAWRAEAVHGAASTHGTPWTGPYPSRADAEGTALNLLIGWFSGKSNAVSPGDAQPIVDDLTQHLNQEALF